MADQPVEIVEYDVGWATSFVNQRTLIEPVLAPWLAGPVEHIGATSVPGLAAKPIVDMLAPVHSLDEASEVVPALEANGWLYWPEDPNRHYRLWFLRPRPDARTHHLHVIERNEAHALALLTFRDALRADRVLRGEYAQLKRRLAVQYRDDRDAYTDAKSAFVESTLRGLGVEPPGRSGLIT